MASKPSPSDRPATLQSLLGSDAYRLSRRVIGPALHGIEAHLPPGSCLIEIGYGYGTFSCLLAAQYGWRVVGYEINARLQQLARQRAVEYGVERLVEFRVVKPDETWKLGGRYDGVLIKQVLHNAASLGQRAEWLDWVLSVLRHGGTFLNFETCRSNAVTRLYRRLRKRPYKDLCLYCRAVEQLYRERFSDITIAYAGGVSQFFTSVPVLFYPLVAAEERVLRRDADNSFFVSIVARKGAAASRLLTRNDDRSESQ